MNNLSRCLLKHSKDLKDFDTGEVVEAAQVYVSRGRDDDEANALAIEDHLDDLRTQRNRIAALVIEQFKAKDPAKFAQIEAKAKGLAPAPKAAPAAAPEVSEKERGIAMAAEGIDELISLLGGKTNLMPEEEARIIPVMSKIFRGAAIAGYATFKDAARWVYQQIHAKSPAVAEKLSIENLQAGYINIAKEIGGDKRAALDFDSIEQLLAAEPDANPEIDAAAHAAATSPLNDIPQPTDKQKEAGNYRVGKVRVQGLDISIENPRGSVRSGTSPDGKKWQNTLAHHYGYIKGTTANDGDHLDIFLTNGAETAGVVWVIDQKNKDGSFDEHKIVLGPTTESEARAAYLANYDAGWDGIGAITSMPVEAFKSWASDGKAKRNPLAYVEAQKPKTEAAGERQPTIADLNSGKSLVDGIKSEIAKWVANATQSGAREMDRKWERGAVKRFIDAHIKAHLDGKQIGNRAAAKIAVAKSETFAALVSAVEKMVDPVAPEKVGASDTATTEDSSAVVEQDGRHENATAPEHIRDDTGVTVAELKQIAKAFRDAVDSGDDAEVTHVFDAPTKGEIVRLNDKTKAEVAKSGWLTPEQAKARVQAWRDHAANQYDDPKTRGANNQKIVISLFDLTGKWSQPWEEAGYQVYRFDIQNGDEAEHNGEVINIGDINNFSTEFFADIFGDFDGLDVHAILAACPCTDFAVSGARHFAAKDEDGRTVASIKLVKATLATIEHFKPSIWALENPVGRIEELTGLPPWRLSFDPNHFGDPYTKKTLLWGRFNADLPVAPVEPTEGSKMHSQYGGKSQATKNARSATPEGFAYGFFMANNAADHPALAVSGKYDRLDRDLIETAVKAGIKESEIDSAVEDFYYQELNDDAANDAIRDLIEQNPTPKGGLPAVQQQLFVEFGGQTFPVESLRDASEKWERFRDETGVGSSEVDNLRILDQNGKQVAYVSYNGRVWPGKDYNADAESLYDPRDQRESALPQEREVSDEDVAIEAQPERPAAPPADEKKPDSKWLHDDIVLLIDQKGRTKDRKALNKVVELLKQRMDGEDIRAARVKTYTIKFKREPKIAEIMDRVIARLETEDREATAAKRRANKQAKEGQNGTETTQAEPQPKKQPPAIAAPSDAEVAAPKFYVLSADRSGDRIAVASVEDAAEKFRAVMAQSGADRPGIDVYDGATGQPVAHIDRTGKVVDVESREQAAARSETAAAKLNEKDVTPRRVRFISRGRTDGERFAEAITEFKDITIPELPGRNFFVHTGDDGMTVITERETGMAMARGNTERLAYKSLDDTIKLRPAADIEKIIASKEPLSIDLMNAAVVDLENREETQKVADEQGKQSERSQDETARISPFAGRWVRSNAGSETIRAAGEMTAYINQHTDRDALQALWQGMVSDPKPIDGVGTIGSRTAFILDKKPYVVDIQERGGSERQVLREVALEDVEAAPSKYFDSSKPVYHKDAPTPSSATTHVAFAGPEGNKRFAADVRRLFGVAAAPVKGEVSPALADAVRLLGAYTAKRFNIDILAGNAKASVRAHIMAALQGVDKVPQAKAGITALRDEFYRQAGIQADTSAGRDDAFEAWAKGVAKPSEAVAAPQAPSAEDVERARQEEKRAAAVRVVEKEAFAALSASAELINAVANTPDNAAVEAQAQVAKWIGTEIFKAAQAGDAERAKALDALMKDGQPVLPESFFAALVKEVGRAVREARLDRLRKAGNGALAAAMTKAGGDAAAMTAFRGGWEHALAGKTKSTLPNDAAQVGGYEAAQAWLKTEDGRSAYQGKRSRKMQDSGVDLRRWFDEQKGKIGTGESDAVVSQLDAATTRSELFRVVQPATPGGLRWLDGFRGRVRPFKRWLTERGPLSRTYGRYFSKSASDETRIRAYIDGETYLPEQKDETREARIQRLRDAADEYVTLVSLITAGLDGSRVKSLAQSLHALVFKPGVDSPNIYRGEGLTENGTQIVPLLLDASRDVNKYGAEGSYAVRDLIKNESQTIESTRKQPLTPPRLDRVDRDGDDYRAGQNVSADNFKRTFNFADGKIFGEYVKARQDQDHLNYSFDAFGDLAKVLGVPPAAISLGGRLYFTIGKLGAGKFAAHYQPQQRHPDGGTVPVINVTNTRGDGTVAHEWGHALDLTPQTTDGAVDGATLPLRAAIKEIKDDLRFGYNFDRLRASVMSMLRGDSWFTNNKRAKNTDEGRIENAIQSVDYYNAPGRNRSAYYSNALKLDGSKKKDPYWSNDKELFARAFEAWVSDVMENQNTYLVNPAWVGDGAVTDKTHRGTPYPTGQERERFATWFDALRKSLVYDDDAKVLGLDADKWAANKPVHPAEWKQTLADLKAEIPAMLEQVKREQAAKKAGEESAVAEGKRMKPGDFVEPRDSAGSLYQKYAGGVRVMAATPADGGGQARIAIDVGDGRQETYYAQFFRIVKTAEQAEAEAAPRVTEELQQPSPEPGGELSADDLSRMFDEAVAELQEESQEQPAVEAAPATIKAADGWTDDDLTYLRDLIEGGQIILLAGNELGLPTIHDMPSDKVRHMGFGVFTASTPEWEANWTAGGAMSHTPGGKAYTEVSVTRGEIDPALFDRELVVARLSALLRGGETPAAAAASLSEAMIEAGYSVISNPKGAGYYVLSPGQFAVAGGQTRDAAIRNGEAWHANGMAGDGASEDVDAMNARVADELNGRVAADDFPAQWDAMGYGPRQDIAQASAVGGMRAVVHRISGSRWAQLSPGEQDGVRKAANKLNKERAASLLSGRSGRIETDAEKAAHNGSLDDATDKTAAGLAAEAAKLGVKGIDEAMKGLVKLFGGGPGKLQSFPAGLDEDTYRAAKPHFEAALKAFQEAGKTVTELFKFLIKSFGAGVKDYAIYFAQEQNLTANLGAAPSATRRVAQYVRDNLKTGTAIRWQELFAASDKAWGGTQADGKYTVKDAYDAMEAGVNLYLMDGNWKADAENAGQAVQAVRNLTRMIDGLPTQTKRTAEQDEFQQFSTPPALAYVASWVANITAADTLMEPSAGTGDLAVYAKNTGARLILNELSSRRAAVLKDLFPGARLFTENAEQLNNVLPDDARPTVVVMNPPFSATAGRVQGKRDTMNGAKHIEQALKRLPAGGRLVAIVGEGMGADKPAFKAWWKKIGAEYNVRANIGIDGKEYAKYGTTFDNQILVIDKNGPTIDTVVTGKVGSVADLPALLEGIRNDRPEITERQQTEPAGDGAAGQGRDHAEQPDATGDGTVDAVGAEQRPSGVEAGSRPGERPASGLGGVGNRPGGQKTGSPDAVPDPDRQRGPLRDQPGRDGTGRSGGDAAGGTDRSGTGTAGEAGGVKLGAADAQANAALTDSVFEPYRPQRLKVDGAKAHPGKLVQSAAMAAVEPPEPTYTPNLPKEVIAKGLLSEAQIEAVVYAGQAHSELLPSGERRGFFIGDGTGTGKGREISGIILDNMRQGRKKAVWVSFNEGLLTDAKRDFAGVGGDPDLLFFQGKTKAGNDVTAKNGILFTSYSTLKSGEKKQANDKGQEQGKTRLDQIAKWLGEDFDGVIVFDESHSMGNVIEMKGKRGKKKPAQQAIAGVNLQALLPKARVVYVSATGATEVTNLGYATRLGLWGEGTAFADVKTFIGKIAEGGVAAMELISRDMKALGMYISRSLSFDGVTYQRLDHDLTPLQHDIYNELARAWQIVLQNVNEALAVTNGAKDGNAKGAALSAFWGSHQRFFNQVITSLQTPTVIDDMRRQIDAGNAVVIQLVNTNEATQEREVAKAQAEGIELEELDFTPRQVLMEYVANRFPVQAYEESTDANGNTVFVPVKDKNGNPVFDKGAVAMRDALLKNLEQIRVPENPIDAIIQAFGTEKVGEVTGRGRRFVQQRDDQGNMKVVEEKRGKHASQNDAAAFQNDEKPILIFSGAGGTGFSFHADLTAKNQRKRYHYILQPGWRADAAVQGFGRSHRTNQKQEPHYVLPTTNLKAQKRFVSSIARRLDQLGALTRGQRQATSQGLFAAADNLENGYAEDAMEALFNDMYRGQTSLDFSETTKAMGLEGMIDAKTGGLSTSKIPSVSRFLNRLLSLTVEMQDQVFGEFEQRLTEIVNFAIQNGTYDNGLQTLKAESIKKTRDEVAYTDKRSGAKTNYIEVDVTNAIRYRTWDEAKRFAENHGAKFVGWIRNPKQGVMAMVDLGKRVNAKGEEVHRGLLYGIRDHANRYIDNLEDFKLGYIDRWTRDGKKRHILATPIAAGDAQVEWEKDITAAPKTETHREHLIVGAILPIWDRVKGNPKIYRLQTDDGERMIGRVIDKKEVDATLKNLGLGSTVAAMTPTQVLAAIKGGAKAVLANGWSIEAVTVSNDKRIELSGSYFSAGETSILRDQGVFFERIQWKDRAFIPTGDEGVAVFERITKSKPVVDLIDPGANVAESPAEGYNDPYDNLETRPGTVDDQLREGRDASRSIERAVFGDGVDRVRGGAPTVLGLAISKDFREDGGTSFTGKQVSNPRDLALLAQVVRDPRFETVRIFYTRGDTIVGQAAMSSRLPAAVYLTENFAANVAEGKTRFNADGYWMVHNHPSGSSTPSKTDERLTADTAREVPGFLGHVVIDHNEYSTIEVDPLFGATDVRLFKDDALGSTGLTQNPTVASPFLGERLSAPIATRNLAKNLQVKDGFIVVVGVDAMNGVRIITEVADAAAKPMSRGEGLRNLAMLRKMRTSAGVYRMFAIVPGDYTEARYHDILNSGIFTDVVGSNGAAAERGDGNLSGNLLESRGDKKRAGEPWFVEDPAYHGSPYEIDRFSTAHIGTGEGSQAYGWGLYFASAKEVAKHYKERLSEVSLTLNGKPISALVWATGKTPEIIADSFASGRLVDALRYAKGADGKAIAAEAKRLADEADQNAKSFNDPVTSRRETLVSARLREFAAAAKAGDMAVTRGRLYAVELAPEQDDYLSWDKPLAEQSEKVRGILDKKFDSDYGPLGGLNSRGKRIGNGESVYRLAENYYTGEVDNPAKAASEYLHSLGVRGIKYKDGSSRYPGAEDWKVKSPEGMIHRFGSRKDVDAYVKGRDGYEITEPQANYNYVIFDDADITITAMESRGTVETTDASPAEIRRAFVKAFGESVVRAQERAGLIEILPDAAALRVLLPGVRISNSAKALFFGDRAYFIADRMNPATAHREALHEIGEHYGLKRMLGNDGYRALVNRVKAMRNAGDDYVSRAWNFVVREYIERESDPGQKLVEGSDRFMHEVMAQIGQNADVRTKPWWKAMIAEVRRWLVKTFGFTSGVSSSDIQDMVLHSLKTAARPDPRGPGGGIRGSRMANTAMASAEPGFAITDAMREKALAGLPLFSKGSAALQRSGKNLVGDDVSLLHVLDIESLQAFTVIDTKTRQPLGAVTLGFDAGGDIAMLADIQAYDKGAGIGSRILDAVLETAPEDVYIVNMLPDAVGFWQKKGVRLDENYSTEWRSGNGFLGTPRRGDAQRGRATEVARDAAGSRAQGNGASEEGQDQLESRGNFIDDESAAFLRNNRPAPVDRISSIIRNPDRWFQPVIDGAVGSLRGSSLFGALDRSVHTQLHKAQKNPYFGAVFNRLQHFMADSSRAALRPAELAPTVLPRIDVAQSIRPAFEALIKGKAAAADIDAAFQVALAGTLNDTVYRNADEAGLTAEQFRIYREYRDSIDASLDELAAGEAWRIARTLFLNDRNRLTPEGQAMKKRMLDDPTEAAGSLSGFISRELDAATLRAQQLAAIARERTPFLENTGDDLADMKKGLRGDGSVQQDDAMRRAIEAIERANALRDTAERVGKIFSRATQLQGEGYAPLMRFGQHYLTVTRLDPISGEPELNDDGEKVVEYFSLFESAAERDKAEREMRELYGEDPSVEFDSGTMSEKAWERYQGVSPESLALFAENFNIEIGEAFQQYYRVAASTRSTLKRLIHRKGTPGFSTDGSRVLASFLTSNGRRAATLYHEGDIQEALSGFPKQMGREQDEAIELVRYVMDNPNEEAAAPRALMFMHFLGGTVSNFIINATQPAMVTLPYLSKTVGMTRAMALLKEAYGIRNKPEEMSAELRGALERADQEGKVGAQEIHHLWQETARPIISKLGRFGDAVTYRAHAFMQLWGMPFAVAELMNRQVTFISAYNAAKESGKTPNQAYSSAIRAVDETQFIYGKQNRPNWARGTWGSLIFTFKLFSISYTELLVRLAREGAEGRKAALYMLGMLFLAAGAQGMPGADDLDDLIDTLAQMMGYNTSMKLSKRQFLERMAGKEFAGFAMHGLSALTPLDVSGRMSLGNLLPATDLLKPSNSKKESALLEIMGPVGGLATSYLNTADAVATGNWRRASTEWLPKAFKDLAQGAEMMASGEAKDTHGRRVTEVSPVEAAVKMIGFNPQAIAEVGRNARAVQQTISLATRTKGVITEKWARGIVDRNPEDVAAAKRDIESWNAANPETPITIKLSAVALRANAMRATKEDRFIKAATKEMKDYVKEAI